MLIKLGRRKPKSVPGVVRGAQLYLQLLLAAGVFASLFGNAHAELPVPCGGGACAGRGGPSQWLTLGNATPSISGANMTIHQSSDRAILNWQSFNIGKENSVNFQQPGKDSVALNRIWDGDPSKIFGKLTANGELWLINRNGIVFGENSQVNTSSLIASTLDVSDSVVERGLKTALSEDKLAAFEQSGSGVDAQGNPVAIRLEPGAKLTTQDGGHIFLFAPAIENGGEIVTDNGQVVLAAGQKVWLEQGDNNLRGILVEVDSGGRVTNLGDIIARRGNATLVGLAINQDGLVSATTASNVNGSIFLHARDNVDAQTVTTSLEGKTTRTGEVEFGSASETRVDLVLDDPLLLTDDQKQPTSRVEVMGKTIHLADGARVIVPGGTVTMEATVDPRGNQAGFRNDSRVQMESGSLIDVSGTTKSVASVSRNIIEVELRGLQLADAPSQRNGALQNQTVKIDIRTVDENGNIPIANVKEVVQSVGRGLSERFAAGGTVTLKAEGDVVLNPGSVVDVSGGQVRYEGGMIETTQVISNGRIVDISAADPNAVYSGVAGVSERSYDKWGVTETYRATGARSYAHYEAGYVEGKDAGTLNVAARGAVLNGEVRSEVTPGTHQRAPASGDDVAWKRPHDQAPLGGQLIITDSGRGIDPDTLDVLIQSGAARGQVWGSADELPADQALVLAPELFDDGVNRLKVYSNGSITLAQNTALTLDAGGSVELVSLATDPTVPGVDINGRITVASGSIRLETPATEAARRGGVRVGANAVLDVAGQWINDTPTLNPGGARAGTHIAGGKIGISSGGDVTLESGSVLNADGGAWLGANGKLKAGRGGDIGIESKFDGDARITLDGEMHGYALDKGGTFALTAPSVLITSQPAAATPGQFVLAPEFFQSGGFSAYKISANRDGLTVADGTHVAPRARNYVLDGSYRTQVTGTSLDGFADVQSLPDHLRAPVNLTLSSRRTSSSLSNGAGTTIGSGAHIDLDAGASLKLNSDRMLIVDGAITARGGQVELKLSDNTKDVYRPDQAIWLGEHARIDTSAIAQLHPSALGLREGRMLDGGSITLNAERGFIVTEAGSELNVSGAAQAFDLRVGGGTNPRHEAVTVAGTAGSIALTASDGMLLDGSMRAHAADVDGAAGGSLSLTMRGEAFINEPRNVTDAPQGVRVIEVAQMSAPRVPEGVSPGDALLTPEQRGQIRRNQSNSVESVAYLSQDQIAAAGFDSVALSVAPVLGQSTVQAGSNAEIRFDGEVDMNLRRGITLDAPVIVGSGGNVNLTAPYIALGHNSTELRMKAADTVPQSGDGTLRVDADHVDLIGTLSLQGFGSAAQPALNIHSNGDVRMQGIMLGSERSNNLDPEQVFTGGLRSAGDVVIEAAQLYPSTLTHYSINVEGTTDGTVRIASTSAAAAPLSAAGALEINAPHVVQGGTVRAPFGSITLNGSEDVTLEAGSVTSVSGAGLSVPFGKISVSRNWVLPSNSAVLVDYVPEPLDPNKVATIPGKAVNLQGPVIDMQAGAVVDVAGGGDLTAYEFIPGPGGSRDVLDPTFGNGSFAVAPTLGSHYAPPEMLPGGSGIESGTTVYLSGVDGLPAGEYAVLPARYAMLPGAFLVTPGKSGAVSPDARTTRADGVETIAGRYGVAGTDIHDSLWSAFTVENGAQVRRRTEYREVTADEFFTAQARTLGLTKVPELPSDAGSLVLDAGERLNLAGQFRGESPEGRAGRIDVLGDRVAVVKERSARLDRIELVAADLNQLGAQSLLLGGRRQLTGDGVELDVSAESVEIESGASVAVPELILAATAENGAGSVTVREGATVDATGGSRTGNDTLILRGDVAMVRVSSSGQADVERSDVPAIGVSRIVIEDGAALHAADVAPGVLPFGGSIALDAAGDVINNGELRVADGGALHLGASLISLGETSGRDEISQGIVLSNENLAALDAGQVRLFSASTLDLYGAVDLAARNLVIGSRGLRGLDNDGKTAVISATNTLQLTNVGGAASADAGDGHGALQLTAREIQLGTDTGDTTQDVAISGFDQVQLNASERIVATGAGQFHSSGDVTLQTGAMTAASAADWTVRADGALRAAKVATQQAVDTAQSLGAKLRFSGESIDYRGDINLASGVAAFTATGADGDVRLGGDAVINVAGVTREFVDVTVSSPGGRVELNAQHGDVIVDSGVRIVVAGGQNADAGTLKVVAPEGQAQLDGSFRANVKPTTDANGNFILDVAGLGDFSALNTRLNEGGFGGERNVRVRNGDLLVDGGDVVKAHDVTLTADGLDGNGNIEVRGTIDASGADGGSIAINAARDVSLRSGSTLDAHATGESNDGGRVFVATRDGEVAYEEGASIDVRGTREVATYEQILDASGNPQQATDESGQPVFDANGMPVNVQRVTTTDTGSVWFRAPQVGGVDGVAVTTLAGNIVGAGNVTVEAFKVTQDADGSFTPSDLAARAGEAQDFMDAHAADIAARLGRSTDPRFHLVPGVEIGRDGDLDLNEALDLLQYRFGPRGEAGVLTLRASGDVQVNANISDGAQDSIDAYGIPITQPRGDASWSLRIVAGGDTAGADSQATTAGAGDVSVGPNVIVRTGSGDIDIAAGRDVVMQDNTSAVYTLGFDDGVGTLHPDAAAYFLNASYAVGGGDVRIAAGRDVVAAPTGQLVNNWLARIGGPVDPAALSGELPTAWAVNAAAFKQGVAALGGGDVAVHAGRDIRDFSVSVTTTGKQVGENEFSFDSSTARVISNQVSIAGGDRLDVTAGRDIKGGVFYLGQGEATLSAGARIGKSDANALAPLVALGDTRFDVRGGTGVELETAFNPTLISQNLYQSALVGSAASYFSTYTARSTVELTAVTGDVVLGESNLGELPYFKTDTAADVGRAMDTSTSANLRLYPATMKLRALQGDVRVEKMLDLAPDPRGQLELLASDNVRINDATITMRNLDPASVPTPERPASEISLTEMNAAPLHAGDDQPVRIYAMDGYIGAPSGVGLPSIVEFAKAVHFHAGGDIRDLNLKVLHASADDHSVIEAGGDYVNTTGSTGLTFAGGGHVDVIAGGSIDLGTSVGIRTTGNRDLPYLPERGANITIIAGLKRPPDYDGFIRRYLVEARDYDAALADFLADRGVNPGLGALDNFTRLPREMQREFLVRVFFSELRKSTPETDTLAANYKPGFDAIATLFPDGAAYQGDLTMLLSQIKTEDGGDVNLLVPGGLANVGVANTEGLSKNANELGIVVAREGDINAFVNGNFLVNSSRVFALDGGNIVLWSSVGDIDAGKGSKSALSIPAPTVVYNSDAKPVAFDAPTSIEGSGIRQAVTTPGKEAGSVYLFAPKGKIDAGDAGIDIAGNLVVGATTVVGTDNIKVGGVSVGVPVSDSGALAGTLSGVSNIASGVSKSAEQSVEQAARAEQTTTTPIADAALTFLDIEVLGYGEGETEDNDGETNKGKVSQ